MYKNNLIIIVFVVFLFAHSCSIKPSENKRDVSKDGNLGIAENTIDGEKDTVLYQEQETSGDNPFSFENADWYSPSAGHEAFNGLNQTLLEGVVLQYVKENHIDKKRFFGNYYDSIYVDLYSSSFLFLRKTESHSSLYDLEYNKINNHLKWRWGYDETPTKEEIKEMESQKQKELAQIDLSWKNIKAFDNYFVTGDYEIIKVKNDSIEILIKGGIEEIDALAFHIYGGIQGMMGKTPFDDVITIDLSLALTEIGKTKYYDYYDLQIINKQSLKYIRNQFFARKGYIFKTDQMKEYFSKKKWYTTLYEDVNDSLSKIEKYNINLIKQLEEEVN